MIHLQPRGVLATISRRVAPCIAATRHSSTFTPVDLAFDVYEPKSRLVTDQNMVICHGLFGSKQNWRSLAKAFAQKLGMNVYTIDLRNHGVSPAARPHSYEAMAADIAQFLRKNGLDHSGLNLLGHSMGGKAAMAFALDDKLNKPLRTLVSVDMSPSKGTVSPDFAAYIKAMQKVDAARLPSRTEADSIIAEVEPNLSTRQFLLTNAAIEKDPETKKNLLRFRIPLDLLAEELPAVGDFPYSAGSVHWDGPTLFLKGSKSKYINKNNLPICKEFFPNAHCEELDAGHWVHAEKPTETVELVGQFIKEGK